MGMLQLSESMMFDGNEIIAAARGNDEEDVADGGDHIAIWLRRDSEPFYIRGAYVDATWKFLRDQCAFDITADYTED